MVLFPFRRNQKRKQRNFSIWLLVVSIILMLGSPVIPLSSQYTVSGFSIGVVLGIAGLIYLFDAL